MKTYLITTGAIFGLLTIAHILRVVLEDRHLATDPGYLLITLASAGLCIWAWCVLRRLHR